MTPTIVVGVDGSESSLNAVDLATTEALGHRADLRVVHAFVWPYMHVPLGPEPGAPAGSGLRAEAERITATAVARASAAVARATAPLTDATGAVPAPASTPWIPDVSGTIVDGFAAAVLLHESRDASMVVVGDRGLGGISGMLLGSVAIQLASHATAPVIVVRGHATLNAPILVAVDGSAANENAVAFAFAEASARRCALTAMLAWSHPHAQGPGDLLPLALDPGLLEAQSGHLLANAISNAQRTHPDVPVDQRLVRGRTRHTLIEATREAQLVVVGSRGRGAVTGLLGSVSHAIMHRAHCPVAVVSPPARPS